ncbi:MAG TPA: aminoglycoside phosphotransferase family protein [Rickettsiales bacterium]|nr:aminoglycoside phosphotransferase family protein [Rickettsiales bacterium]
MENIKKLVKKLYKINYIENIKKIGGFSSDNFVINDKFLLKIIKNKTQGYLEHLIENYLLLNEFKLPLAMPVINIEDKYYSKVNENFIILFPYFKNSKVLHEANLEDLHYNQIAYELTKFHKIPTENINSIKRRELFSLNNFNKERIRTINYIENNPIDNQTHDLTIKLIEEKEKMLSDINLNSINNIITNSNDLVHGDFHNENILFDLNDKILCFLDFEEMHIGNKMEDVINFILFACCNSGFKEINLKKSKIFINHYNECNSITKNDMDFGLEYAILRLVSSFFLENKLYESKDLFFTKLLERDLNKIKYFKENKQIFLNNINNNLK